ncbi:tautomerase family protein [Helicobacter suis]|uniref:tautomerase family protein n=1 Tax=Helicobacter suis TaxID=104628 RepID=UPI0013D44A25|nr:4-oxalocrotonate tautomerase family protein [Helicobacter suis]
MPLVNIKLTRESTPLSVENKKALIEGYTDLLVNVLGKKRARTIVIIEEVDTDDWGIGGQSVTELK